MFSKELADRLESSGVSVIFDVMDGCIHLYSGDCQALNWAIGEMASAVNVSPLLVESSGAIHPKRPHHAIYPRSLSAIVATTGLLP